MYPDFVEIPAGMLDALRRNLRLGGDEKFRICYLSLANDVARVQHFWVNGEGDPRSQKATYAGMFFELVEKLDAEGMMVSTFDTEPPESQPVRIARVEHSESGAIASQTVEHVRAFQPHLVVVSPSVPIEIVPQIVEICPTIFYAHSLLYPRNWAMPSASFKQRIRRFVRIRRGRKKLCGLSGILGSSDFALTQMREVTKSGLPVGVTFNQYISPPAPRSPQSGRRLLYVGALDVVSGADLLVEAFKEARKAVPELTLTMIGTGPLNETLLRAAEQVDGLEIVVGYDRHKMDVALANSDLVIAADRFEGMQALPIFLPEALMNGVPALISSATPARETEQEHCAVFKAGELKDLERQIVRLSSDQSSYAELRRNLPMPPGSHYDRSQSWGSGIVRLIGEIFKIS